VEGALVIFLTLLLALAGNGVIAPVPVDLRQVPAAERFLLGELAGEENVASIASAGLYDLGAQCMGKKLFALTFFDLKVRNSRGEVRDMSAHFTGSAGTRVVVFVGGKGKALNILFDEVLMDWWGVTDKKDCAAIKVRLRRLNASGVMVIVPAQLVFKGGAYVEG